MSKTRQMQARDARVFGDLVRTSQYRGKDKTLLRKGDIAITAPVDHGARPLLGKFSTFTLSRLTPAQRKVFVEQLRFELSLPPDQLNDYISSRYSPEDMVAIWELVNSSKITSKPNNELQKRRVYKKARQPISPEEQARRTAKQLETLKRNKSDPNHVSYATLKAEFRRLQKLVASRTEVRLKELAKVYAEPIIAQQVYYRTAKLERENQKLKEYLRQNNMPLPGTKAAKMRRERLRQETD